MSTLVNPQIELTVFGAAIETVISNAYHIEVDIFKDLSESPNTADVTVYNLGPDIKKKLQSAEDQETPLEIKFTTAGKPDTLISAYKGEIQDVYTDWENPGHATHISCATGKANHRQFPLDEEFAQGTPKNDIIEKLIEAVGLPTGELSTLPTTPIGFSHTFTGPAFRSLEKFVYNHGMRAYITDGVLHVVTIGQRGTYSVFVITPEMILGREPSETSRNDAQETEIKTIVESIPEDPPDVINKRNTKTKQAFGSNLLIEYDGIDKLVNGLHIPLLAQPIVNPDQIVSVEMPTHEGKLWRVQSVNHRVNNISFNGYRTDLEVDEYTYTGGIAI